IDGDSFQVTRANQVVQTWRRLAVFDLIEDQGQLEPGQSDSAETRAPKGVIPKSPSRFIQKLTPPSRADRRSRTFRWWKPLLEGNPGQIFCSCMAACG